MIVLSVVAGLLGLAAVVYLVVALLKPEKF
jgi:K+-transporting ATPase KdpF subunit